MSNVDHKVFTYREKKTITHRPQVAQHYWHYISANWKRRDIGGMTPACQTILYRSVQVKEKTDCITVTRDNFV